MTEICIFGMHKWVDKYFPNPEELVKTSKRYDKEQFGRECLRCGKKQVFISVGLSSFDSVYKWVDLDVFHERFRPALEVIKSTEEFVARGRGGK